jgi:hypothetical protein
MRGHTMRTAIAVLLMLAVSVAGAATQNPTKVSKPSKPVLQSYTGEVEVTKDKSGDVRTVKLTVGKVRKYSFNVTLDKKGKELGEKMAGKQANLKASKEKKGDARWLTIQDYSEVPAKTTGTPNPSTGTAGGTTTTPHLSRSR